MSLRSLPYFWTPSHYVEICEYTLFPHSLCIGRGTLKNSELLHPCIIIWKYVGNTMKKYMENMKKYLKNMRIYMLKIWRNEWKTGGPPIFDRLATNGWPRTSIRIREYTPVHVDDVIFGKISKTPDHFWKSASTPPPPLPLAVGLWKIPSCSPLHVEISWKYEEMRRKYKREYQENMKEYLKKMK